MKCAQELFSSDEIAKVGLAARKTEEKPLPKFISMKKGQWVKASEPATSANPYPTNSNMGVSEQKPAIDQAAYLTTAGSLIKQVDGGFFCPNPNCDSKAIAQAYE